MEDPETPPPEDHRRSDRRRLIGLIAGLAAAAAVVALLVVGLTNRGVDTSIDRALAQGERPAAPDITLPVLLASPEVGPAGAEVSLADLRGRTVVLNVWASWCGPCRDEAPVLESVWRRSRDRNVIVLGLNVEDLSDDARAFAKEHGVTFPSLRDPSDGSKRKLGATGVPETFVIDPEGRVALHVTGPITDGDALARVVDQVSAT